MAKWKCLKPVAFNRYQLIIILSLLTGFYPFIASVQLFPVFANFVPEWKCGTNGSLTQDCNVLEKETCFPNYLNGTLARAASRNIEGVQVVIEYRSAASDFGLYCKRRHLASLVSTLQMVGLMTGSIVFGQLSDTFGRKPVVIYGILGTVVFNILSVFAPNVIILIVLRFLTGTGVAAFVVGVYTVVLETSKDNQRLLIRSCFTAWGFGRILYTGVAYTTRDWRYTFIIMAVVLLPLNLIGVAILRESSRWLLMKGRTRKVQNVADFIDKINNWPKHKINRSGPHDSVEYVEQPGSTRNSTYKDLFRTRELTKRSLVSAFLFFACSSTSYGLDLNIAKLPGDIYTTQFAIALCLTVTRPLLYLVDVYNPNFGRKILHRSTMTVALFCIGCVIVVDAIGIKHGPTVSVVIAMVGLAALEWHWDSIFLLSVELFPTVIRSSGIAFSSIVGRFGNVVAPQIVYLSNFWSPAPYIVFMVIGSLSIVLSALFLPETKDCHLPDSINLTSIDECGDTNVVENEINKL